MASEPRRCTPCSSASIDERAATVGLWWSCWDRVAARVGSLTVSLCFCCYGPLVGLVALALVFLGLVFVSCSYIVQVEIKFLIFYFPNGPVHWKLRLLSRPSGHLTLPRDGLINS